MAPKSIGHSSSSTLPILAIPVMMAWAASAAGQAPPPPTSTADVTSVPNFDAVDLRMLDTNWQPAPVVVGVPFFPQLVYDYLNPLPVGSNYGLTFRLNTWSRHFTQSWRNGSPPGLYRVHSGAWPHRVFEGGQVLITAHLDIEDHFKESSELDNRIERWVPVSGDLVPEWELLDVRHGWERLGDGTDVVIGTMDDALDLGHPMYQGDDSLGRPRLVAAWHQPPNPDGTVPNSGHATRVMGNAMARPVSPGDFHGLAPDARFVSAEFLDRAGTGAGLPLMADAFGFLVFHGAEVINMSWSWGNSPNLSFLDGDDYGNLLADYVVYQYDIVCVGSINQNQTPYGVSDMPTAPGSSRNVITVGGLQDVSGSDPDYRAWEPMDHGPTRDGRSKPDLLSIDCEGSPCLATRERMAANDPHWFPCTGATSGATPVVTGVVAQMLDFAKREALPRDAKLIKAILIASCRKALDWDGEAWSHSSSLVLDDEQGAGILDLRRVHRIFEAREQDPSAPVTDSGFDVGLVADANMVSYSLGTISRASWTLDVALAWERHTLRIDDGDGILDSGDSFVVPADDQQDDLDLLLLRDGVVVAQSTSAVDNVEHLHVVNEPAGDYVIVVLRHALPNTGVDEEYAIAWDLDG